MTRILLVLVAIAAAVAAALSSPQIAAAMSCMSTPDGEVSPACGGGGGGDEPPPPPPPDEPAPPPEEPAPPPEEPAPPPDDGCGGCTDPDASGYEYDLLGGEGRVFADHRGSCKSVYWGRERRTWWGKLIFRYIQLVEWCYRNGVITYVNRVRWPEVHSWLWQFGGNVGSNCSESCAELTGAHHVDIQTVGHFQACKGWCFLHSYPGIVIRINGWGGWGAYSWGGGG